MTIIGAVGVFAEPVAGAVVFDDIIVAASQSHAAGAAGSAVLTEGGDDSQKIVNINEAIAIGQGEAVADWTE